MGGGPPSACAADRTPPHPSPSSSAWKSEGLVLCATSRRGGLLPGRLVENWCRASGDRLGAVWVAAARIPPPLVKAACRGARGVSKIPRRVCAKVGTASEPACQSGSCEGSTTRQAGSMHSKRLTKAPRWLPSRARRSWRFAELLGLRRVRLT
jgi:hypothetical protein